MRSKAKAINPEGLIRHNIRVWQESGYPDWHIATSLMDPRLKTPEDFKYWGLAYNPPDGSALSLLEPACKARKREALARLQDALDQAIAGDKPVTRDQLCRMARIGSSSFQCLCVEYRAVFQKWAQLKALNRNRITDRGQRFIRIGQARRRKLEDAARVLDQAIADGKAVTMEQLSLAVGQYSSWFQQLCRDGCRPALTLRERMDEHNHSLRYSRKSA